MPVLLAALAFVACLGAFAVQLFAYQHKVVEWARRDLQSRADLAAANLEELLRTQDFQKIRAFGDQCHAEGVRLVITGRAGGCLFDSWRVSKMEVPTFCARADCGEYVVSIGIPPSRVHAPFRLAVVGSALAGLVGMAGVLLFFFVTYRQRVKIRELAKLEQFRREFIADVSHEIKTPLTGILGAVDMCGDEVTANEGERRKMLFSLIRKEAKRLNALVQSILDLARLERADDVLSLQDVEWGAFVGEIAAGYPCAFTVKASRVVRCDPQLVEQAISNLIGNALRHSGSDEIEVTAFCAAKVAQVVVEDHGVGIPPEHARKVFERFHRVDPARAAETGGAGLGLAIARRIARLHGGDLVLFPVKPHGCKFVFSLTIR